MTRNKIALYNIASTIILQGLAFISGPIFSSILGTSNYGVAAVYLTWVQISSTVFSLQAAGTIAIARVNYPLEEQEKFQSSVLSLATCSYICFSIVTVLASIIFSSRINIKVPMVILGLIHGWGLYCVTAMNSKFTYEFKANYNFFLSITTSACTIGFSIFLIHLFPSENNYWGRIIGQSVVYACIGLFLFAYIVKRGKTLYNRSYWKFTIPIALPTIFHLLAYIVLNQSDKVMLQNMDSNAAAGIYSLACTFAAVLNTIYHALNNSWVPFYYEYTRQDQTNEIKKHARNYIELFTVLAMGFILLSREVFHLYARNKEFWAGTDLIPLFAIGFYFVFLYSFPVNYEFYHKKTKTIAIGTTSAAIINVILNYIMIMWWGIYGAVIATAVAHGLQFAFHYIYARKMNSGDFPFRLVSFFPGLICVLCTCILYWFTRELWYIRWAIGFALGIFLLSRIIKRKEIF